MTRLISYEALAALDEAIDAALVTGDESALDVLGYGEISTVVATAGTRGRVACKRMPLFEDRDRMRAYGVTFEAYLAALAAAGVQAIDSRVYSVDRSDGRASVYCVQPVLEADQLCPNRLRAADEQAGADLLARIVDTILGAVTPTLGLDGQLSNWVIVDGELRYLDVTTPMMRDADGAERMDTALFLTSLPWALRPVVWRFVLGGILDKYYDPRMVVMDLAGNLIKEKLAAFVPAVLAHAKPHLPRAITESEVRRYYASDARTWAVLQRLRHADRWWQRNARRRPYPFLLPGRIDR